MKHCPSCNRTYADDAQQFCLQDGTPLVGGAPGAAAYGAPPPAQPTWSPQTPPPAVKKRKIWPWVLGGLAVLLVGGLVLLTIIGFAVYKLSDTTTTTTTVRRGTSTNAGAGTGANTARGGADVDTSNTELYVNSRDKFTGTLADNYVDFSFRYPEDWKLDPNPAPSFVRMENATPGGATVENFSVGWFAVTSGGGSGAGNTALLSQVINNFGRQIAGNFPDYVKVAEGSTTVAGYSGYELRFNAFANKGTANEVPYWGRVVILPDPNGTSKGVSLIMIASGHSDEVKGQADLGEKGELPIILNTFKLGPPSDADADTNSSTTDEEEEQ
jgi:hypothetical protein